MTALFFQIISFEWLTKVVPEEFHPLQCGLLTGYELANAIDSQTMLPYEVNAAQPHDDQIEVFLLHRKVLSVPKS